MPPSPFLIYVPGESGKKKKKKQTTNPKHQGLARKKQPRKDKIPVAVLLSGLLSVSGGTVLT